MSDLELFKGLKSGDRTGVQSIYDRYLPVAEQWIRANSGTTEDARDLFQECLEILILKIESCNESLQGLIMTIIKRRWIDRLRSVKRQNIIMGETVHEQDSRNEDDTAYDKYRLMEITFEQLSSLCQQLMTAIKRGMQVEQMVEELGFKSANTLYRRKAACIERWSVLVKESQVYKQLY